MAEGQVLNKGKQLQSVCFWCYLSHKSLSTWTQLLVHTGSDVGPQPELRLSDYTFLFSIW